MKHSLWLIVIIFFSAKLYCNPEVEISLGAPTPLYYGDTQHLLVRMSYYNLKEHTQWSIPKGSSLQALSGACPSIPYHTGKLWQGTCDMNLIIHGDTLGKIIHGPLLFTVYWEHRNLTFGSAPVHFVVIPHNLTLLSIPFQEATANKIFIYNMSSLVQFFEENRMANQSPQGFLAPEIQNGLYFDQASFSIKGTPKKIGTYLFKFHVQNAQSITPTENVLIKVQPNPKDKPVFKPQHSMASALRGKKYTMNLMELIEPHASFMVSNQISFRIDSRADKPSWLEISEDDATLLTGEVPEEVAGKNIGVTLIATSNTGGDSEPLKVTIPIAYDPNKKPELKAFEMEQLVASNIAYDLSEHIIDPTNDSKLKVLLDKVTPAAPWLSVATDNPRKLVGTVPNNVVGKKYMLKLRVNNSVGGSSKQVTIPLYIIEDKDMAPKFAQTFPIPELEPGKPYYFDFNNSHDISPSYQEFPYEIKFVDGTNPPSWLHLEANHLSADQVPFDAPDKIEITVVLRNPPGGSSTPSVLKLEIRNPKAAII